MKAKVKATGQIIDVFSADVPLENSGKNYYTENVESNLFYAEEALDFNDVIDWEQRRYEIAKDVLAGFAQNSHPRVVDADSETSALWAVGFADELIKQLKEK